MGLERKPFVKLSGLGTRINTPQTRDLISRLNLAAITVLNNKNDVLPLHPDLKEAAILNVGKPEEIEPFDRKMKKYTSFARFQLRKDRRKPSNKSCVTLLLPTGVLSLL